MDGQFYKITLTERMGKLKEKNIEIGGHWRFVLLLYFFFKKSIFKLMHSDDFASTPQLRNANFHGWFLINVSI